MVDKLISQQAAIDALKELTANGTNNGMVFGEDAVHRIEILPSAQIEPEAISKWKKGFREYVDSLDITRDDWKGIIEYIDELPSAEPDVIRCKDCIYQTESWIGIKYCEAHGDHIGKDYDYCSNARRKENGH